VELLLFVKKPGGQRLQLLEAFEEAKEPALHERQAVMPETLLKNPDGQELHLEEDGESEKYPAWHLKHPLMLERPGKSENVPAGHLVQKLAFVAETVDE
jgi:hypothetical protein